MKIPKSIKIGGKTYAVEVTENISMGDRYSGEIDYQKLIIRIRPTKSDNKEQTFLHEVFHGIFDFCGYKEHDEELIDRLASTLQAILKDNKGILGD